MKKITLVTLIFAGMAIIAKAQSTDGVAALINQWVEASNKHDVKAFAGCFATDADFTNVLAMQAHSRGGIEEFHRPLFSETPVAGWPSFNKAVLNISHQTIRFITPDVASVDIWWNQSGAVGPDGAQWPARKGLANAIVTRENGNWFFKVFHNMDTGEFKPDK